MGKVLKQQKTNIQCYKYKNDAIPVFVEYQENKPALIGLSDMSIIESVCINCKQISCINLAQTTLVIPELSNSQVLKICPTDSIQINEIGKINIDSEHCIGCGLCVVACPVGAIYLNVDKVADINHLDHDLVNLENPIDLVKFSIENKNLAIRETEELFRNIIDKIDAMKLKTSTLNNLICNALSQAGVDTNLTRQGDINLRMDAIAKIQNNFILIEAELYADLDAPRDILDDIAVFCSRRGVDKSLVSGMIVLAEHPNKRTEFWELLFDIYKVLEVNISIISLAALLTTVWSKSEIDLSLFNLDKNNMSARKSIRKVIGRDINLPHPCNLIEAAK